MRVEVGVEDVSDRVREAELRSLHGWFQADRRAWRLAAPQLTAVDAPVPGAQGTAVEVLSLVLGSAFNAASLAVSLVSWRATRPQRPTLTVRRPDGTTITVSADSVDAARLLQERLESE
ncbi:hypothetical protein OG864_00785 [Streptomyces sp. NBC_00124]|uniref:effector-associated constant component EACC1 n=1 Tax=Streptomyces sp. NBC_00124 TaxID=2975662 RepID=UPI0022553FCC|nr:hypothetical protein [Streptomyces sp. NBC_00124]MCX5357319.1 hypothetical protein [Streptomyces sp. NBC_00124]